MSKTTVVVPTFNRAHLVAETLEAVLAQSRPVDRVLVIDDGSTDRTARVLAQFGERIEVVSKPNTGKADSLNVALALIPDGLVWIVDDDDIPRRRAHQVLSSLLEANSEADLAYGRHDRFAGSFTGSALDRLGAGYWGNDDADWFLVSLLEDFFVHQGGMIARRALYDRVGLFETGNPASEDYEMLVRLARVARIVHTRTVIFDQRVHLAPRGAAGAQWESSQREAYWIENDQRSFRRLRSVLRLEEYLPFSQRPSGPLEEPAHRQALLQRATVFARRKLWEEALADLRAALDILPTTPLSEIERGALGRMLLGKYGCNEIGDPEAGVVGTLKDIKLFSGLGAEAVDTIIRSLRWRVRHNFQIGDVRAGAQLASAYVTLRMAPAWSAQSDAAAQVRAVLA